MGLYRQLGRIRGRIRFFKHYCVARVRFLDLESIEAFVRDRIEQQYKNTRKHAPNIEVKLRLLPKSRRYCGIHFDAPIAIVVILDDAPAFGMSLELKGKDIRIRQLHGARGFSFRGRYYPLRLWPRLCVQACQDLAVARRYTRVMLVRSYRSYSWRRPDNREHVPGTPEGIREQMEVKLRLIRRLDGTAESIDGFERGMQWWIWQNPFTKIPYIFR